MVRLRVPVGSLFDSLTGLTLTEKRYLRARLGEQIATAKLREAYTGYQVQNDLSLPTTLIAELALTLEQLLAQVNEGNFHGEVDWGPVVGAEA